jgi:murein DD-endopeptidase MepM/ murein hydrolase activator NlpD
MKSIAVFSLLLLSSVLLFTPPHIVSGRPSQAPAPPAFKVSVEPEQVVNGAPCLFRVTPPMPLESLTGIWFGHEVFFNFDAASGTWYGVAGVGIDTPPGSYALALAGTTTDGERASFSHTVMVSQAVYPTITLRVPKKYIAPGAATLARIKKEQELKQAVFSRVSAEREWAGPFVPPLDSVITEEFGTQRTFNRVRQSVHQGLDYRAAVGTPVAVTNSGTAVLARGLFFEGNCVMIDHGQGLMTLYFHLSEIKVEEGERVRRGQVIGLSGATGRVTAPHVHFAARWQDVYLNPATLLTLNLP